MKLLVAIPSKGRSKAIFKRTMRWVTRSGFDVKVFVEPAEIEAYRANIADANHENYLDIKPEQFIDIGKNDQGLGYVNTFMANYALENDFDLVFRMDDDVLRFNERGKNRPDDEMIIAFATMVGRCRVTFGRYRDLAAIGFGYRNELFEPKEWSVINGRLQTCYIIRTEDMIGGYDTFADFAQYIHIRANNRMTVRYGLLGIDCADVGKTPGGQKLVPDLDKKAHNEIKRLHKIYPALQTKKVKGMHWSVEPALRGAFFGVKKL